MQNNGNSSTKTRLPAWFAAFFWSLIGVVAALLTIFILTASLLWLLRWVSPAGSSINSAGSEGNGQAAVSGAVDSSSGHTTPPAQLTAEAAARLSATPSPQATSAVTSGQSAAVSPATDQTAPSAEVTPGSGLTEQAKTITAGTPLSDSGTQPPPTPSLPQSGTETSRQPSSAPSSSEQNDQSGQPGGQTSGRSSTGTVDPSALSEASSTPTQTPSPSATPSATSTNTPTPTPTPVPEPQEYIVQRDDWLSRLSDKFYGDILAYPVIVEATNAKAAEDDTYTFITDPDVIEIGQKLWIPTPEEAAILLAELEEEE